MKNKNKYILVSSLIIASSLLTGCSRSASSVIDKDPVYAQNLQYSKVGKIIKNNEVQALLNVTYLNSVNRKKYNSDKKQNFIIGTYQIQNDDSKYSLTMNDQNPTTTRIITKDDELYKNIALKNHWGKYELVTFEDTKSEKIIIKYSNDNNQSTTLDFIKE